MMSVGGIGPCPVLSVQLSGPDYTSLECGASCGLLTIKRAGSGPVHEWITRAIRIYPRNVPVATVDAVDLRRAN